MSSPTALDHTAAAERLAALYHTDCCWGQARCHGIERGCGCEACYNTVRAACLTALAARPPADLDLTKLG